MLRLEHAAILIGVETALADDPQLTSKVTDDPKRQPIRVVLDSHQRIRSDSKLVQGARVVPTLVFTIDSPQTRLTDAGVEVVQVGACDGRIDLTEAMAVLVKRGVTSLMIEGGGEVAASFLRLDFIDEIEWFRAPILLGAEGKPAIGGLGLKALADAPEFWVWQTEYVLPDVWERYARREEEPAGAT